MEADLRRARGRKLSILAFAVFLQVLWLPAFEMQEGLDTSAIPGWQVAATCLAFLGGIIQDGDLLIIQAVLGLPALANLLFVLVPVALWRGWPVLALRGLLGVTLLSLLLGILALLVLLMLRVPLELLSLIFRHGERGYYGLHVAVGYVLWVADYALLAAALLVYGLLAPRGGA